MNAVNLPSQSAPEPATSEPVAPAALETLRVRQLGRQDYLPVWQAMQAFTDRRDTATVDEIWLLEHEPVFTQGQAGKAEHVLFPGDIPVIQVDRGGQVTYHGPGQLMVYLLLDIGRRSVGTRALVNHIEQATIDVLAGWGVDAHLRDGMPGVYVDGAKIASLGLRVRRGRSYHGMAFNIDMDLTPFSRINPCGYQGLNMTQVRDHAPRATLAAISQQVLTHIQKRLGYTTVDYADQSELCLTNAK